MTSPAETWKVMAAPGCMPRWTSGIRDPIRYSVAKSATIVQWKIFAVFPYCRRAVIVFDSVGETRASVLRVVADALDGTAPVLRRADENADREDDDDAESSANVM
jgi:hypothetical protein